MKIDFYSAGRAVTVYHPDTPAPGRPIVYLNTFDPQEGDAVWALLAGDDLALACITAADWNGDLSPWPAPRAFAKGEDFTGGAGRYIKLLAEAIVPEIEARLILHPARRYLAGYSLAGLFALYALTKTTLFDGVGSISGSLWYEGFMDYIKAGMPQQQHRKVYLSLGDREAAAKNPRMAQVLDCTHRAEAILRKNGFAAVFELNPGNHYADVPARVAKGIRWLAGR
jgi:predicted alpha/beta superfamily hydrolase